MPLLNNLCPLCGNLYVRVYTNGQPKTMNVALCVLFRDFFNTHAGNKNLDLFQKLLHVYQRKKADNNSLTTCTNMKEKE